MHSYLVIISIFIGLDVLTGIVGAALEHDLSSSKMRKGLGHKIGFYLAFVLAVAIEYASLTLNLGFSIPLLQAVSVYICSTEVVSILENLCRINPELNNSRFMSLFKSDKDND